MSNENTSTKKKMGLVPKIIIGIVALGVIGAIAGGGKSGNNAAPDTQSTVAAQKTEASKEEPTTEAIEYTAYTVDEMMNDLNANAMNASDKYKDQYLEITGKLSNIDSSGKYISLVPNEDFAIIGVQCYIKSDEQKEAVKKMSTNDIVTLRGKCKDVGEVLGYSLDIDSIN
ncbi:hypothetical protein J2S20_002397 [Moryella indoligenes]|uniref:tRNA_anti-like protein n=1 Tax=Moryella indoligenes TaxID=371674 RepID=A0AAE3VCJ0_9FIRM|nr:hypothetical protein [Moryella indoligenes]MDQ0153675.1 hypothetical protein [Moryella indoligenes]